MKQISQWLMIATIAGSACLGANQALAQNENNNNADRGGQRQGRGNFDPAEFRERMMERVRETLEIKDDTEWKAVQPLIQKVMDTRMQTMSGMGRGLFGRPGRPQGDDNAGGGGDRGNRGNRGGLFGAQQPSPEAEALQRAIDSKASTAEMKAALAKFTEARKAKQAELEKAQAELRKVLSLRQEAIAELNGWL